MLIEDEHLAQESLSTPLESDQPAATNASNESYFKKYIRLKRYLQRNENKFILLEQQNVKAIKQLYDLLNNEQKRYLACKL